MTRLTKALALSTALGLASPALAEVTVLGWPGGGTCTADADASVPSANREESDDTYVDHVGRTVAASSRRDCNC